MSKKTEDTRATTIAEPEHQPMPGTHDVNGNPAENNTSNNTKVTTMSKSTETTRVTTAAEPENRPIPNTNDVNKKPTENDVLAQLRISQDFANKIGPKSS